LGTAEQNWVPTVILDAKPVVSSQDLIIRHPDNAYTEVQGGPIPRVISIEHIVGNTAIKIQWEVVVCVAMDCNEGTANDPQKQMGVLSNKWTCADDIDENLYIRSRTFVGELKLARPVVNPHDFRTLVVPPIAPGLRMKSMSFKASEDGLTLQYNVTHEEVTYSAPYPATNIRISHKQSHGEVTPHIDEVLAITMQCSRDVDKRDLAALAASIADGKIHIKKINGGDFRLLKYEASDESGSNQMNQVSIMYHVQHVPIRGRKTQVSGMFGKPIDGTMIAQYDNLLSLGNRPGESPPIEGPVGVAGAFMAHIQSTCTYDHSANRGVAVDPSTKVVLDQSKIELPAVTRPTLAVWKDLQDLPDDTFSSGHQSDMYQSYEIDTQTEQTGMIIQLPVSGSLNTGPSNLQTSVSTGDTAIFSRIGSRQARKVVRVVAKRHGKPPKLPVASETFRDANGVLHVLLAQRELLQEPTRLPDDTIDYTVRMEYFYGMSRPPGGVKFPAPDFDPVESLNTPSGQSKYNFSLADIYSSAQSIG
jgi:hypothetical protein